MIETTVQRSDLITDLKSVGKASQAGTGAHARNILKGCPCFLTAQLHSAAPENHFSILNGPTAVHQASLQTVFANSMSATSKLTGFEKIAKRVVMGLGWGCGCNLLQACLDKVYRWWC